MITLGLIALILVLILTGQPLFVLVGVICGYCFKFIGEEEIQNTASDMFYAGDKEILLAIPLFVLAGNLMTQGSISKRLIRFGQCCNSADSIRDGDCQCIELCCFCCNFRIVSRDAYCSWNNLIPRLN